jgi:beta-glucosidase
MKGSRGVNRKLNRMLGEGYIQVDGNLGDRNNLTLWQGGDTLVSEDKKKETKEKKRLTFAQIEQVAALCNNTIVVVHST